jgi:exopolysaccharide biosynthesis polyprenyl glycosylphosphotransferase
MAFSKSPNPYRTPMLLRLPWLLSRKRLLAAVVIDSGLFSIFYFLAFRLRFGTMPGFSLPLGCLVSFWLLSSYVIGRYHVAAGGNGAQALNHSMGTAAALLLSLGAYLAYFWLTASTLAAEDSRGFLVPLLLFFSLLSSIGQGVLAQIVRTNSQHMQRWFFMGAPETYHLLLKHLAWSRISASIEIPANLNQLSEPNFDGYAGFVVEDFNAMSPNQLQQLLRFQNNGKKIISQLSWCELVLQRFPPELLNGTDLLRGQFSIPLDTTQMRLKRLGDLLVSGSLLLLTVPILLMAALLIRLQDGGPVLYSQLRSGFEGRPYRIRKLRTMRVDAERHGAQWVGKGDARITPLGRLLRLTRLDELPQLWAVLQGEMSLIGPRPERPEFEEDLERQIPHYRLRHLLRPGLSGWAQVNFPYGASVEDAANKLSYDLYYLRNFSFWLDLLILFKTIRLVFNAQGAEPINK